MISSLLHCRAPDGTCLLVCSADCKMRIFNLPSQLYSGPIQQQLPDNMVSHSHQSLVQYYITSRVCVYVYVCVCTCVCVCVRVCVCVCVCVCRVLY